MYQKIKEFILDLLFPRFCLGCQKEGTYLCPDCKATLDILENFYCLCNKNPVLLPSPPHLSIGSGGKAGKCKRCNSRKLSGLYFALSYQKNPLIKKLIYSFKYEPYLKELAQPLSSLIIEHFLFSDKNPEQIWKDFILIPIPLDKKKLKKRGFNQAQELARELSKNFNTPLISGNLIKIKTTLPQVKLSGKDREENIKNAFYIKNPVEINQKKILLIDDVYTTGSTMEEAARILKEAGAKEVWGVVVAREG